MKQTEIIRENLCERNTTTRAVSIRLMLIWTLEIILLLSNDHTNL